MLSRIARNAFLHRVRLSAMGGTLLALALTAAPVRPAHADPPHYTLVDIGALGKDSVGQSLSLPRAINAKGQVVGNSSLFLSSNGYDLGVHAFLYSEGVLTDLTALGPDAGYGCYSAATGINDDGIVVGFTQEYGGDPAAGSPTADYGFRYAGGQFQILGNLGVSADGLTTSEAYGLNASGIIAGYSTAFDTDGNNVGSYATLFSNGLVKILGALPVSPGLTPFAQGVAINASGQVAGFSVGYEADGYTSSDRAILISGGAVTDLGTLSDPSQGNLGSRAYALNAAGQVVGASRVLDTTKFFIGDQAFLYSEGKMTSLGTFASPAYGGSRAWGINTGGTIVGSVDYDDGTTNGPTQHGFLYTAGTLTDLNALVDNPGGWIIEGAFAINDSGQIAAQGFRGGSSHALLLTPVSADTGAAIAITPGSLPGGTTAVGTVTLAKAATSATTIVLASNSGLTRVPAHVTIAAGKRAATFNVVTGAVRADTMTSVTGKMKNQTMRQSVRLHPVHVKTLLLTPARVKARKAVTGTFILEGPAGPGALTATFASSNAKIATLRPSLAVNAGATRGTFLVQTGAVTKETPVTLTMTLNGVASQVTLTVIP